MDNTVNLNETLPDNIIFIEFYSKKNFPPGAWAKEPDFIKWKVYNLDCVMIRDMRLGMWRGFVGVPKNHKGFNKSFADMINEDWGLSIDVHGGISTTGKLPQKHKDLNKNLWWIGFECTQGEDLMPLVKIDKSDPLLSQIANMQSYKDVKFARKETNSLAKQLCRVR